MIEARTSSGSWRAALAVVGTMGAVALGCLDRPVAAVVPVVQSGVSEVIRNESVEKVDLLMLVDNSGSMADNQANIMAQLGPLINQLTNPPCISRSTPGGGMPHECRPGNPDDVPQYPAVKDLHVGVVSSDLGTPGFGNIPGCDDSERGDHGFLNPIRNGPAMQSHLPWAPRRVNAMTAPPGFRPAACNNDPNQFPSFITFCSNAADASCDVPGMNASTRDPAVFADWFKCNAGLFVNGCGLEQQLEAIWRALVWHDARSTPGNTSVNANFLREDALLAIVVLSDEEDGSVRNCEYDGGFSAQTGGCSDAREVYNAASMAWAHPTNLDLRFYLYTPGSPQDPTWNLDRYVNTAPANTPNRWNRDLLSLKPGHPERIIFAAITGVPLQVPTMGDRIDWDKLLGAQSPAGPNDFYGRDSSRAISGMQEAAGPFSMRAANMDPQCSHVLPACRREGSTYDPGRPCSSSQYMAYPSRRIVEIARRFDEAPLCNGQPCRNGLVTSICSNNFTSAMRTIVQKIASRIGGKCLPRVLQITPDAMGNNTVSCIVREILPEGSNTCDPARGRRVPELETDRTFVDEMGVSHTVCDIQQIPTNPMTRMPVSMDPGWYYDTLPDPQSPGCTQRISFTSTGAPGPGTVTRLECIQSVGTR